MTPLADLDGDAWSAAWEHALAELEMDVETAERLISSVRAWEITDVPVVVGAWAPPTHLGPLPETLLERAQLVLTRQLRVIEDIANAAVRSRQHLEVQRRMRPDDATSRPMFVDAAF